MTGIALMISWFAAVYFTPWIGYRLLEARKVTATDHHGTFDSRPYRAIRAGGAGAVDGLPTFADGARAADITDAVLRSAKGRTWEEVPQP